MREDATAKARRLLGSGKVDLLHGEVLAGVSGDHARYRVERDARGWWSCDCPSFGPCSNARAVVLVVPA
jgi:hypothetical protein